MKRNVFILDNVEYNVDVIALTRQFSVVDSDVSGTTQNGEMYRDPIGTYYNYTMTVAARDGDMEALDAFWEAVSQPVESHVCEFPYNQETLAQRMYVTSGEQNLRLKTREKTYWDAISLEFVAMSPKVVSA